MFYCVLHNWYSSEEPCPACFPKITVTTTTSSSGTSNEEIHQPKEDKPERDWEVIQYGYAQSNENKPDQQYIHSVKRPTTDIVYSIKDDVESIRGYRGKIAEFIPSGNDLYVRLEGHENREHFYNIQKPKPKPKEELKEPERGCGICGGKMVLIRGKYPGMDKREVCPTCNTERLEQINEISSKSYGQAYQVAENQSSLK